MNDNQNEIAKFMCGRKTKEKEEIDLKNGNVPPGNDNDKCIRSESKSPTEEENDKPDKKGEDVDRKKDKGRMREAEKNAKQERENDNKGEGSNERIKESRHGVKEDEVGEDKHVQTKNKEGNKGKEVKENEKGKSSSSPKKSNSKSEKENENKSSKDDKKSLQKRKKSDHSEKDNTLKSDETIRSDKSDSKEDQRGDKKKRSSKKKKSGKGAEKDSDKREDDSSDRKKERRESGIKAATRRDFCTDTEDDENSRGKERGVTKKREDDEDKPRGRDSWERKRDDYDSKRERNGGESYCRMRGCERWWRGDRWDDYQHQNVSNNNFRTRDGQENRGCFMGKLCSDGKKSSYREVRISRMDCSRKEKDGRRDVCSREGRKEECGFLAEGKRDMHKPWGKEERTERDGICLREYEERRERQRKPESRGTVEGYGRDRSREDAEGRKNGHRDHRRDWYRDEYNGKRDLHRDERRESSSAECDAKREGSGTGREKRRGAQDLEIRESVDDSGERREGRGGPSDASSCTKDERDRREVGRSEDGEEKNARNDYNIRRFDSQWTKDEIYRLKDELISLQTELEQMKACLKTAVSLAERNKCTMTKLKEHLQCNLPDFAKIREKLRECQLLRLRLCGEGSSANKTNWKKDFEFLICELNAVKCELENVKKERR